MSVYQESFQIQSDRRPTFHDVTAQVQDVLKRSGLKNGILLVFSQHTTCSVLIQEAADDVNYWGTELLMQDLVNVLENIIPTCRTEGQYLHPGPQAYRSCCRKGRAPLLVTQYGCASAKRDHGAFAVDPGDRLRHDAGRVRPYLLCRLRSGARTRADC